MCVRVCLSVCVCVSTRVCTCMLAGKNRDGKSFLASEGDNTASSDLKHGAGQKENSTRHGGIRLDVFLFFPTFLFLASHNHIFQVTTTVSTQSSFPSSLPESPLPAMDSHPWSAESQCHFQLILACTPKNTQQRVLGALQAC